MTISSITPEVRSETVKKITKLVPFYGSFDFVSRVGADDVFIRTIDFAGAGITTKRIGDKTLRLLVKKFGAKEAKVIAKKGEQFALRALKKVAPTKISFKGLKEISIPTKRVPTKIADDLEPLAMSCADEVVDQPGIGHIISENIRVRIQQLRSVVVTIKSTPQHKDSKAVAYIGVHGTAAVGECFHQVLRIIVAINEVNKGPGLGPI